MNNKFFARFFQEVFEAWSVFVNIFEAREAEKRPFNCPINCPKKCSLR